MSISDVSLSRHFQNPRRGIEVKVAVPHVWDDIVTKYGKIGIYLTGTFLAEAGGLVEVEGREWLSQVSFTIRKDGWHKAEGTKHSPQGHKGEHRDDVFKIEDAVAQAFLQQIVGKGKMPICLTDEEEQRLRTAVNDEVPSYVDWSVQKPSQQKDHKPLDVKAGLRVMLEPTKKVKDIPLLAYGTVRAVVGKRCSVEFDCGVSKPVDINSLIPAYPEIVENDVAMSLAEEFEKSGGFDFYNHDGYSRMIRADGLSRITNPGLREQYVKDLGTLTRKVRSLDEFVVVETDYLFEKRSPVSIKGKDARDVAALLHSQQLKKWGMSKIRYEHPDQMVVVSVKEAMPLTKWLPIAKYTDTLQGRDEFQKKARKEGKITDLIPFRHKNIFDAF